MKADKNKVTNGISIRIALPEDMTNLAILHAKTWKAELLKAYGSDFLSGLTLTCFKEKWKNWLPNESIITLLAEDKHHLLGFITVYVSSEEKKEKRQAEICFSYINPERNYYGDIEHTLYEALFVYLKQRGIEKSYLWTLKDLDRKNGLYPLISSQNYSEMRENNMYGFIFHEVRYDLNMKYHISFF